MKKLSTAEIRRSFLEFFKARGHAEVASSPLVLKNDPSLLFTNAGMVQFKSVFTGAESRDYSRATTSQKCLRAGGKHNDLENVGYTPRHHTFFEMLGNFSFGDYFKEDAIKFAFELLINEWGLPMERLAFTVFKGEDGIEADEEAAQLWEKVGVPKERIFRLGKSENYWTMGATGPQGPCSEIHYYLPEDLSGSLDEHKVAESIGWMEIWNLVFMQFEKREEDGPLLKLPKPCVDTGAGLERLSVVLQGKTSNYEIDVFTQLLGRIGEAAGKPYDQASDEDQTSMRVIADHARATAFLMADGVLPGADKETYVLRRIMRRAIRHGDKLGFEDLFLYDACLGVVELMKEAYPQLHEAKTTIETWSKQEEKSFRRTLKRGLERLEVEMKRTPEGAALDPLFAGDLKSTYGFPADLTRVIAGENGRTLDEEKAEFWAGEISAGRAKYPPDGKGDAEVNASTDKPKAKGGAIGKGKAVSKLWFDLRDAHGATTFSGYSQDEDQAEVQALIAGGEDDEPKATNTAKAGDTVRVLLGQTPFYGESGGQVGDTGTLSWAGGQMKVVNTIKPVPELHIHVGTIESGELKAGDKVTATVDAKARNQTRKNHSATHLLHLALKEVLGDHVQQKGSLVGPDRLRFDFAHFEPLNAQAQTKIEARVNAMILDNAAADTQVKSLDEAREAGAMMLFGEKYADEVRMIQISDSLELCGGTHVARAGDIGLFKITSEGGLASGVRRVEAVTGMNAVRWVQSQEARIRQASAALKTDPKNLAKRIEDLVSANKGLERDLQKAQTAAVMGGSSADPLAGAEEIGGLKVLFKQVENTSGKALRDLADQLRDKMGSGVIVLSATSGDKASVLVAATKDLKGKVHAGNVVKAAAEAMGKKGGGRPDFAQGGGSAEKLSAGLDAARAAITGMA